MSKSKLTKTTKKIDPTYVKINLENSDTKVINFATGIIKPKPKPRKLSNKILNQPTIVLKNICVADIIKIHFDVNSACEIINNNVQTTNKSIFHRPTKKQNFELVSEHNNYNMKRELPSPNEDLVYESDFFEARCKTSEWFLDLKKNKVVLWPVMANNTKTLLLPLKTNHPCRQCHQRFSTSPIGCPLEYNSNVEDWMTEQLIIMTKEYKIMIGGFDNNIKLTDSISSGIISNNEILPDVLLPYSGEALVTLREQGREAFGRVHPLINSGLFTFLQIYGKI